MEKSDAEKLIQELRERIAEFRKCEEHVKVLAEEGGKLPEEIAGHKKAIETLTTSQKDLRDVVEKFTRQVPQNKALDLCEPDPEYARLGGRFPNARMAQAFHTFAISALHSDARVRDTYREKWEKELRFDDTRRKAMGESVDTAGGYLVPEEMQPGIIRYVNEYGVARQRISRLPMASDRKPFNKRTGGFTLYYPDEGGGPTASDLTFARGMLTAKRWSAYTLASEELLEDADPMLGELIAEEFGLCFAQGTDNNVFNGDGTSGYSGVVGVLGSANVALVTMPATKTTFSHLAYPHLVDLFSAVPAWVYRQPDCAWYMSSSIKALLLYLTGTDGRPLFTTLPDSLFGKPIVPSEVLPTVAQTAVSKKFVAFGSLRAWGVLGERKSLQIKRSRELKFLESQEAFMATMRADAQEAVGEAMATLRTAAS